MSANHKNTLPPAKKGPSEFYLQFVWKPPYPNTSFAGRTIIVTGANIGLGRHAASHFTRLGAAKVVIAVRSVEKGEAARAEIEAETGRKGICEVWPLDLAKYASVKDFAARVANLDRLDHAVLNASVAMDTYERAEDNELSITVNVVSNFLLSLLLLPTLRRHAANDAVNRDFAPSLTIVGSSYHKAARFPQRDASNILEAMNNPETAAMGERYAASKLLQLFLFRELADRTAADRPRVIVNMVNPGFNKTALTRNAGFVRAAIMAVMQFIFAWEAEEGSRTLVHAAVAGPESHGVMLSECNIWNDSVSGFVPSAEGVKVQEKLWNELVEKLEAIEPGITKIVN